MQGQHQHACRGDFEKNIFKLPYIFKQILVLKQCSAIRIDKKKVTLFPRYAKLRKMFQYFRRNPLFGQDLKKIYSNFIYSQFILEASERKYTLDSFLIRKP